MKTIDEYNLTIALLKKLYLGGIAASKDSQNLSQILQKYPKLVVALNHGPMAGAIAGLVGVADMFHKNGGSARAPFGITWRTFYKLPILKQILSYLTQVDKGLGFDDASDLLSNSDFTDCFIMPEGELCNFGNGFDIQPFLSPRFIELAICNQTPVLLVVHQGSENWAWPMVINDKYKPLFNWLPQNMKASFKNSGMVSIPKPFRRKLNRLFMSFYLYQPALNEDDLSAEADQRLIQLTTESDKVRKRMQKMALQLKAERQDLTRNP